MTTRYLVSIASREPLPADLLDELQRRLKEAAYEAAENSDYDVRPTVLVHLLGSGERVVRIQDGKR